jgi:hypothetical protein
MTDYHNCLLILLLSLGNEHCHWCFTQNVVPVCRISIGKRYNPPPPNCSKEDKVELIF